MFEIKRLLKWKMKKKNHQQLRQQEHKCDIDIWATKLSIIKFLEYNNNHTN